MANQNKTYFTTPLGRGRYVWLTKPDTKYDTEGKYKTDLICDNGDAADLVALVEQVKANTNFKDDPALPFSTDEETGEIVFKLTTKFPPQFFDSQGQVIPAGNVPRLMGGSQLRLSGSITTYDMGGKVGSGITLNINRVQIVEAVEASGGGGGFEAVEGGFVAEAEETFDAPQKEAAPKEAVNF
jgi:hypothetical protein